MKNKLSFLNLLLGIIMLVSSCEMQTKDEIAEPKFTLSSEFSHEAFAKVIPYKFNVDWANPAKGYSQELQKEFYEYNIIWLDNFNPDVLEQSRKHLNMHTTYKIIAVPDNDKVQFYSVRLVEKNTAKTPGLSLTVLDNFTGRVYLTNEQNEKIAGSLYVAGKFGGTLTERSEEEHKQFLQTARMGEDCYTVQTYHYTDYYNGSTGEYLYSILRDVSYSTMCGTSGGYDGGSSGGSGGSWSSGGDSGSYEDCGDPVHGCFYEIEDVLVPEEEAWEATQIDDTQLAPCMQPILNDLTSLASGVAQTVKMFSGNTPGYNWEVKDGLISSPNTNAFTNSRYDHINGKVTTIFDSRKYVNSTDLSVARTILHESVHAYLVAYFNTDPINANISYAQLVQDWYSVKRPDLNAIQHDEMVRSFVNDIALTLQNYGISKGYNLSSQFYQDLAWGGLDGTRAFQNLSSNDRNRILNTILIEMSGKDAAGQTKSPKGKPSNC